MTHVSERLNNQNVSYNKFKMCSNKTVLPHACGKTAPRLFTLILGLTVVMIWKTMCFIHYLFKPSLNTTIIITHREQK